MNTFESAIPEAWDVVVIGSGMGGATAARYLVEQGLRVLLLERGGQIDAEMAASVDDTPEGRLRGGWWPHPMSRTRADGKRDRFHAPVGCAVGGTSLFYAAALERMAPSDFEPLQTKHQRVPEWPVSFAEFEPYYEAAERMYGVGPITEPESARKLADWDKQFLSLLRRNGLKPDLLRVGIRYDDQCQECVGKLCPRRCKADARSAGIDAIMGRANFRLVDLCEVTQLEADSSSVTGIRARRNGTELRFKGRIVVLAAGALHTPYILLRSASDFWPRGLANSSDQVGRNLMFHTAEVYAVWSRPRLSRKGRQRKAISLRDFYQVDGVRLGYVQSMGLDADYWVIAAYLKNLLQRRGLHNERLLNLLTDMPARIAALVLGNSVLFGAMSEDDPDPDNRIVLDPAEPNGCSFSYTITDDLRRRADSLYAAFAKRVAPWRSVRVTRQLEMNYGHPCGTCRFGADARSSVLDSNCRTHDLDNLYIADASFMPRSSAVNPSLTIAANALRVAGRIAERLRAA